MRDQICNLMSAACARRDDFCARWLTIDLIDQVCGHLDGEIVFLCERAKRARHSAAAGIEDGSFSAWQSLRESFHERRIHDRLRVAMRVDRDRCGPIFELKRVWIFRE